MKKLLISALFFTFLFMSLITAQSVVTLDAPATDAVITGSTANLSASLNNNGDNVTTLRFYYRNDSHTGGWTLIDSVSNTSAQQIAFNITWDTTAFWDDNNIEFNVTAENSSGNIILTTGLAANISIDNGLPTATYSSDSLEQYGSFNIQGGSFLLGLVADNTIGITNCTVTINSNVITMTATDNVCSLSLLASNFSITTAGEYTYTIDAIDANNNHTNTTTRQFNAYLLTGGGGGGGEEPSEEIAQEETDPFASIASGRDFKTSISDFFGGIMDFFRRLFSRG